MTISGELLAPGGNTPTTYQNMNADAIRLGNGGTVLAYLTQIGGDNATWDPTGPVFDGILKVLGQDNQVLHTISLMESFVPDGRTVMDVTVERLAHGGFVVAWSDINPADMEWSGPRVRYAIFDEQGDLLTSASLSRNPGYNVRVTALADGGFATVFAGANYSEHAGQGVVTTFAYDAISGGYVKGTESYLGDPNAPAPGANADVYRLTPFDEFSITGLSDGGFVIGAPTYDYVSPSYTPLGDFVYRFAANGAQTPFASGNYWQRVNWNDGQVNNAVLTKSFDGGFVSVNRGKDGNWQLTVFNNDGSLITTTEQTEQVSQNGGLITKTFHATDVAPVPVLPSHMYVNYDNLIDIAQINGEIVVVLPNEEKGFSLAWLSMVDGSLLSVTDMGIMVPPGTLLTNPRIIADVSGWDFTYDVLSADSSGYYHQSTYQIGLSEPTIQEPLNQAPMVSNIEGDSTDFILGTPQYIDAGDFADVADPDSSDFEGGHFVVRQVFGSPDGNFSFDLGVGVTQILWGSGTGPDTSHDGVTFTNPGPLAVGDKLWYGAGNSTDPADWILLGTVTGNGRDGADLRIEFSNVALAVPSMLNGAESFASSLFKYLMYTAPTLGARSFEVTIADGDGAISTPVYFDMTGTADQTSTLTSAMGVAEPVKLPTSATDAAGAVSVFDFTLTDAGTTDGLATRIDALVLQTSGTGDFAKVTWLLSGPGIDTPLTGIYNTGAHTLNFAGTNISVANGGSAVYTVKAYINDSVAVAAGTTYQLSIDGDSGVTLANGMSSLMAANQSAVTTGSGIVVVGGPGVLAIERTTPVSSPTNADSLTWTVRFSEAVSQIDAADFDVAGLSGETVEVASAGANTYTVTVSGGDLAIANGSVTLALASGQNIVNGDGQALAALTPTGTDQRSYLIDNTAPAAPSVPDMQAASDSGALDTDSRTSTVTPTFIGTAEAGAQVTLYSGSAEIGTATATGGIWTITTSVLAAGEHTITAVATDASGNISTPSSGLAVTIDTSAAAPVLVLQDDTGSSGSDGRSKNATVDVILDGDVASWEYSTNGGGSWSTGSGADFTLAPGSYAIGQVRVRQTDVAGNTSAAGSNASAIDIDTTVAAPTLALASDTGASAADGFSRDGTVNVSLAPDAAAWEYRTSSSGTWSAGNGTSFMLDPGSYAAGEIQVRQTDLAGNLSSVAHNAGSITIRSAAATPSFALASDTGTSVVDGITRTGTINVNIESGATWEFRTNAGAWTSSTGNSFTLDAGTWDIGAVEVRQTDLAGNLSAVMSNGAAIVVDQNVVAPGFDLASDTGTSASDGVSSDGTVTVSLAADVAGWEYRTSSSSTWNAGSGTAFVLAPGVYAAGEVQVRQTDLAGNISIASANPGALHILAAATAPSMALANDSGASSTDGISRTGTVNVTLTGDVASWEYSIDGGVNWNSGSGTSFTLLPGTYLANSVQVRQTDVAGNLSTAGGNANALVIDADAPVLASIARQTPSASTTNADMLVYRVGLSENVNHLSAGDFTVSGSTATVSAVQAIDGKTYDVTVSGGDLAGLNGTVTLGFAAGQDIADTAGNALAPAAPTGITEASYTLDNTVSAPVIVLASDTGNAGDGITRNGQVGISGLDAGASWEYSLNGGNSWTAGSGTSFALASGSYTAGQVQVRQTDTVGNVSPVGTLGLVSVDTVVAAPSLALASDAGTSSTDGVSRTGTVSVTLSGDVASWEYSTDSGVNWNPGSATSFMLASGAYPVNSVQVRQTDVAGNISTAGSNAAAIVIDAAAPVVNGVGRTTLSQPSGSDSFTVDVGYIDLMSGFDTASLDINDILVTGPGAVGTLTVSGVTYNSTTRTATYTVQAPSGGWNAASHAGSYTVGVVTGGVSDLAGNGVTGNPSVHGFDVVFNAIPQIKSNGAGASAMIDLAEGKTAVTTVMATDGDQDVVSYSITGGADQARFSIDGATGALGFVAAPSTSAPGDTDQNNSYEVQVTASDGKGGADVQNLTVNVLRDLDSDGTADADDNDIDNDGRLNSVEDPVPGALGLVGDGNGDGTTDSHQANVSSLPTAVSGTPFVTLAVGAGMSLTSVSAGPVPTGLPRNVKLPLGQIDFTIESVTPGGTVEVSIYVDTAQRVNSYFKQDNTGKWVNITKSSTTLGSKTKITFDLKDGGVLDSDGIANGRIVDPGGVALITPLITSDGGTPTASISIVEGHTGVTTAVATSSAPVTYSIGGADAALFTIDPATGALRFRTAPDYGQARDTGDTPGDNIYVLDLTASDGAGSDTQTLKVKVEQYVAPSPTPVSSTIDGVPVTTGSVVNGDGSTSQVISVPVVVPTRPEQVGNNTVADIPLASIGGTTVLAAQVPTGFGLQVTGSGSAKTAGTSVTDLIREIKAHTEAGSQDQTSLTGGGSGFLTDLPSATPLFVQTIVATAAPSAGAPKEALVINGNPATEGSPMTALVIDTRALPSGSTIQLQNVEFAAVIGAANVTGGAGSQNVWGDSASQTIILGADDDVLHGGAGDDIVGSAGGNDKVHGDEGNDIVFGGLGNDHVDGGAGHDIALLAGGGRLDYSLRMVDGKLTMTHLGNGSDGLDTISNVETLRFATSPADTTIRGTVTRLYEAVSGKAPDIKLTEQYIDAYQKGTSVDNIAKAMLGLNAEQAAMSNEAFVKDLYENVLHRTADHSGAASWIKSLDSGVLARENVALAFANSAEKLAMGQALDLDFSKTDVATLVRMYSTIFDRAPDEAGLNYWIAQYESGRTLSNIADGFADSLESIGRYTVASNADFVNALYQTAFHRTPQASEVNYWIDGLNSGAVDRGDVLLGFADSAEKVQLIGVIGTSFETL